MARLGSARTWWRSGIGALVGAVLLLVGMPAGAVDRTHASVAAAYLPPLDHTEQDPPWGLDRIDQRALPLDHQYHYGTLASGVTVYVVDSGIRQTHQEFGGRAQSGPDFITRGGAADDCYGHGTHVAAIIGGQRFGVAKGARLIPVRTLDCDGAGPDDQLVAAVDWITAHAARPAVVNMSLRADQYPYPALDDAVRRSIAAGITYVVAAGNDRKDACSVSPADVREAITVGSVDDADGKQGESNYGRCVDLFAPGVDIDSAAATSDTATMTMSGTSMATAYVSGVAALYLARNPSATPAQVQRALTAAATRNVVRGAGPGSPNALVYSGSGIGWAG